jgi:hypothetical protein
MNSAQRLRRVLDQQTLDADGPELTQIREQRAELETILRSAFPDAGLSIRYGGSKAKGTMIKAGYDLDAVAYFHHDNNAAGSTLPEMFRTVIEALDGRFLIVPVWQPIRKFVQVSSPFWKDGLSGHYCLRHP